MGARPPGLGKGGGDGGEPSPFVLAGSRHCAASRRDTTHNTHTHYSKGSRTQWANCGAPLFIGESVARLRLSGLRHSPTYCIDASAAGGGALTPWCMSWAPPASQQENHSRTPARVQRCCRGRPTQGPHIGEGAAAAQTQQIDTYRIDICWVISGTSMSSIKRL